MFDYFELSDFKEKSDRVEIYFEEKNIHPKEYATDNLESKGFYEQVRMQDYPMRGRSCLFNATIRLGRYSKLTACALPDRRA